MTLLDRDGLVLDPPELGCVLYLPGLPGSGGRIYDRSPYANSGTITGATWKRLPSGMWYLDFDGSDDYVNCGTALPLYFPNTDFSIETWIHTDSAATNDRIVSKVGTGRYELFIEGSAARLYLAGSGGIESVFGTTPVVNTGRWHHIAALVDRTKGLLSLYVDSLLDAEPTDISGLGTIANSDASFMIGGVTTRFFPGGIALTRVYSRVLTGVEIQDRYTREKCLFGG